MPTKDWFDDNPKVSAYVSRELYEQLEAWMKGQNIKKVSQALTAILEQHLGKIAPSQESNNLERVEALEGKLRA